MPHETVLIIEDDPAMLEGLEGNFEFEGYTVGTASDGEEGLNAALEGRPDLIVLDIMLPKINGYEVCRLVRREGLDVPIIMLTAKGQESDIVLGLELGAEAADLRQDRARRRIPIRRGARRKQRLTIHPGNCLLRQIGPLGIFRATRLLRSGYNTLRGRQGDA